LLRGIAGRSPLDAVSDPQALAPLPVLGNIAVLTATPAARRRQLPARALGVARKIRILRESEKLAAEPAAAGSKLLVSRA
jgi:hypothetical protein